MPETYVGVEFSLEYLSYLSKYSNNSVSFSEPKNIEMEESIDSIKKLFETYISAIKEVLPHTQKKHKKLFDIM